MSKLRVLAELVASLDQYGAEAQPKDGKARTRARILRTATELFQRRGYRHVSIDEVARESGVAKGTVYVHFKSKSELLFHAIAEEKKGFIQDFVPLLDEEMEPEERLRRYIELGLLSVAKAPLIAKLASGDREVLMFLEELGDDLAEQVRQQQTAGMAALLEGVGRFDQLSPAEQRERTSALLGILYSAVQVMDERVRGGVDPERYAKQIAKMIVDGIGAP